MSELKLTLEEAINELTGFEVLGIEKEFGMVMEKLGGVRTLMGTIWAYERRDDRNVSWTSIKSMSLKDMRAYFPETSPDPESEQAFLSSPGDPTLDA